MPSYLRQVEQEQHNFSLTVHIMSFSHHRCPPKYSLWLQFEHSIVPLCTHVPLDSPSLLYTLPPSEPHLGPASYREHVCTYSAGMFFSFGRYFWCILLLGPSYDWYQWSLMIRWCDAEKSTAWVLHPANTQHWHLKIKHDILKEFFSKYQSMGTLKEDGKAFLSNIVGPSFIVTLHDDSINPEKASLSI